MAAFPPTDWLTIINFKTSGRARVSDGDEMTERVERQRVSNSSPPPPASYAKVSKIKIIPDWRANALVAAVLIAFGVLVFAQSTPTSIRAGLLIDGTGKTSQEVRILIEDGVITRMDRLRGAVTHDLSELVLMPGWIDTHVHLTSHIDPDGKIHNRTQDDNRWHTMLYALENAYSTVMAGFTTVQGMSQRLLIF